VPLRRANFHQKGRGENIPSTKIEISFNKIERLKGIDDLARVFFPANKNQQRIFLAIFIELKYAPDEFLPNLLPLCSKYGFTPRMLETVRSKMRRMGIIDHVCRFNKALGYREGWILSCRFSNSLNRLSKSIEEFKKNRDFLQERKDRDLFSYI
jgi:hypothetical protein